MIVVVLPPTVVLNAALLVKWIQIIPEFCQLVINQPISLLIGENCLGYCCVLFSPVLLVIVVSNSN